MQKPLSYYVIVVFLGKHIHFIGIKGVSMMALAKLVELDGAVVSGSDLNLNGHKAQNITPGIDLVIMNGAIADDNPELERAKLLNIPIIGRDNLLAMIASRYTNTIAVAGTHGKSTTTAMVGAILTAGGFNPTIHNGAHPNLVLGGKDFFVTEACEYKRSFLKLKPTIAVITNIDADHLDCYANLDEITTAFNQFSAKAKHVFRTNDACKDVTEIHEYKRGKYAFSINDTTIKLGVFGRHNVENACLAIAVGLHLGIEMKTIVSALESFTGVKRRFESKGSAVDFIGSKKHNTNKPDCDMIVDFAHHPTEIQTTVDTATDIYGKGNFLIIFQPHTYTRTLMLFEEFISVLSKTPVALYKTYSAREKRMKGGEGKDLAKVLRCKYMINPRSLNRYINHCSKKYKAIILTGAGDFDKTIR